MFSVAIDISKFDPSARVTVGVDFTGGGSEILINGTSIPSAGFVKTFRTSPVKRIVVTVQADSPINRSYGITY